MIIETSSPQQNEADVPTGKSGVGHASESVTPLVSASALKVGRAVAKELQQSEIFALQLAAIIDRDTGLRVLSEALERAANTFAMLTDPKTINTTPVYHAWAQAVEAEKAARAVLKQVRGE